MKKNIAFIPPFDYIIIVEAVGGRLATAFPVETGRGALYPAETHILNKIGRNILRPMVLKPVSAYAGFVFVFFCFWDLYVSLLRS